MNPNNYFEEIGAWPRHSKKMVFGYVAGFVLSLGFTLGAYLLATHQTASEWQLMSVLIAFAIAQFGVQAVCFLHLNGGKASRERLIMLSLASLVVCILVSGSLWIMFTLNGRQMLTTAQMEQYMVNQEGI